MLNIGFIGYGSMGSMLIKGFIKSGVIAPEEIVVSTRTKSKLDDIRRYWPEIIIAESNTAAAAAAKYIFVCVKPMEIKGVLEEIKEVLKADSVVISIAASVSVKNINDLTGGKVTVVIPSMTSEALEGVSLVCHNELVADEEAGYIETLLNGISKVKRVQESDLSLASELTSCAPGFFAAILDEFVKSALRQNSGLSQKDAEDMVVRTFFGTAKVLAEQSIGFGDLIGRVATKGGVTEEGVKIFRNELPGTFDHVFKATMDKRSRVSQTVDAEFKK